MAKESTQIDSRLRDLGVDPAATPAQMVAALATIRGNPGVSDAMIAQTLGGIADPAAAAMLVELASGATGAIRREIRRELFKLRQRGIVAPAAATILPSPVATHDEAGLTGLLSAADASGARVVWLIKTRGSGGLRRLWGLVTTSDGLVGATLEPLTRKEYRAERAEVERRAGTPLIETDWKLVDFILCEAWAHTPEASRGRVGNFLTLRAELIPSAPPQNFHHPVYDELAAAVPTEPSVDLMKEPDISGYQLPPTVIKPYADEVAGLRQSVIVLSRVQQEERVGAVVERALTELIIGDRAYHLRRHLEDTAYLLAHIGSVAPAAWAVAAAAKIRDHADLTRSPFFQSFMRAQLGAVLADQAEKERDEPHLIMTPAEMMRARQAAQARRRGRG